MPIILERLGEVYQRSGMSYAELEKMCGIPRATLYRYITGKTEKIPMDALEKMARAFGVSTSYLMGWRDSSATEERPTTDDDLKFALFGDGNYTDAQLEEVKRFAAYIRSRDKS